jgi:hypothetical protein
MHLEPNGSFSRHRTGFIDYYHHTRCHLAQNKDAPEARPVQPPELGRIVSIPQVGGLHHRYERRGISAGNLRSTPL